MNSALLILGLIVALFLFDFLFILVPIYCIAAEIYCAFVLDKKSSQKAKNEN